MKDSGKDNFEKAWQDRFEEASVEPDERVWAKIETHLANKEAAFYKKRVLYFQLLAAASLVFAIGIGYYNFNNISKSISSTANLNNNNNNKVPERSLSANKPIQKNPSDLSGKQVIVPNNIRQISKNENKAAGFTEIKKSEINYDKSSTDWLSESSSQLSLIVIHRDLPEIEKPLIPLYPAFKISDNVEAGSPDITVKKQQMWAGVDMASGVFNPNISYGSRSSLFNFNDRSEAVASVPGSITYDGNSYYEPEKSSYSPNMSYSYGVNMGFKIAPRWILIGGVGYQFASSSSSVNKYIESTALSESRRYAYDSFGKDLKNTNGVMSINTSDSGIDLNSDYEFISLPVTTGYFIVDRKIKWALNGGIATDILLKNSIYDPDNFLSSVEFRPGKNSPYRTTMFSGIFGTSVYLPLFKNYRVSIFPSYRFGFNYMTKESSSFNSKPSSFMISAGMAYIFK